MLDIPKIQKSNNLVVRKLMETYGTLGEVFIVEAIRYYSEKVSASTPKAETAEDLSAQQTWKNIATSMQMTLKENFEGVKNEG